MNWLVRYLEPNALPGRADQRAFTGAVEGHNGAVPADFVAVELWHEADRPVQVRLSLAAWDARMPLPAAKELSHAAAQMGSVRLTFLGRGSEPTIYLVGVTKAEPARASISKATPRLQ